MVKMAKKLSLELNRKDISSAGGQLTLQAKRRMNSWIVQFENILCRGAKLVDIINLIRRSFKLLIMNDLQGGKPSLFSSRSFLD